MRAGRISRWLALAGVAAWGVAAAAVAPPAHAGGAEIGVYRGLGAWVDIFDAGVLGHPTPAARRMERRGVDTLYLETSNYQLEEAIPYRAATAGLIEAAHDRGIEVAAWYLPGLTDLGLDRRRSLRAIRFRTESGERFDSFALDIEASEVVNVAARNRRLLRLSQRLREAVGGGYPLGAITPSPRGMQLVPRYWPGFPYAALDRIYDVFLPMGYFTYRERTSGRRGALRYTRRNVAIVREQTGDHGVPIHIIGGVADATGDGEAEGFAKAARRAGVIGASLYDFATSGPEDWAALEPFSRR